MAALVAATVLPVPTGCSGSTGRDEAGRVEEIRAAGLAAYLPEVDGLVPDPWRVEDGQLVTRYRSRGSGHRVVLTLRQLRTPSGDLCQALEPGDRRESCRVRDGVLRAPFEEMTDVAVVRGGTTLLAIGLVTEADARIADEVVAALREAPRVSAERLARS